MTYLEKAQDLYNMLYSGQLLEAFDKYYHPECIMVEGNGEVHEGKEKNREREVQFLNSVKEIHGGAVTCISSDEAQGKVMIESNLDLTFADGNRMMLEQVAVQQWDGEHIKHERFYYNAP